MIQRSTVTAGLLPLLLFAACAGPAEPPGGAPRAVVPPAAPAALVQRSLETLPSGRVVRWRDTAGDGTFQPVRTFRTASGFCREYALTLDRGDGSGHAWREIACRDPDGVWRKLASAA